MSETELLTEEQAHAILSPSGADRWMVCAGSVALCKDLPNPDSEYSIEGTDYHELASICLDEDTDAADYVAQQLPKGTIVTEENAAHLQKYIDYVRKLRDLGGDLVVEKRVPIGHITGEKGAKGTCDAAILREDDELIIVDLKFGMGVKVFAKKNRQCMTYALGLIEDQDLYDQYKNIRICICQPRLDHFDEWTCSMQELLEFKEEQSRAAKPIMERLLNPKLPPLPLTPSEKGCRFCLARATYDEATGEMKLCEALEEFASRTINTDDMEVIDDINEKGKPIKVTKIKDHVTGEALGKLMTKAKLLEIYANGIRDAITGIRASTEKHMLDGMDVPGWKLAEGKKGDRKFTDEEAVEDLLKGFRMSEEEIYDKSLKTPTQLAKTMKKANPKRWAKVEAYIDQAPGKKSVVPEDDPRPAITIGAVDEGMDIIEEEEDWSDLM